MSHARARTPSSFPLSRAEGNRYSRGAAPRQPGLRAAAGRMQGPALAAWEERCFVNEGPQCLVLSCSSSEQDKDEEMVAPPQGRQA